MYFFKPEYTSLDEPFLGEESLSRPAKCASACACRIFWKARRAFQRQVTVKDSILGLDVGSRSLIPFSREDQNISLRLEASAT